MTQMIVFVFLVLPTLLMSTLLAVLLLGHSSLFAVSAQEVPTERFTASIVPRSELSRMDLNRIVRGVMREDRRRIRTIGGRRISY